MPNISEVQFHIDKYIKDKSYKLAFYSFIDPAKTIKLVRFIFPNEHQALEKKNILGADVLRDIDNICLLIDNNVFA